MIYLNQISKLFLLVFIVVLASCSNLPVTDLAEKQELTVLPSPLELHGDSVRFTMTAKLPSKALKPGTIYEVQTTYKASGGDMIALDPIQFNAADYAGATEQPTISKYHSFLYNDNLNKGQVHIKGIARKGTKSKETPEIPVPNGGMGVITTSRLVQPTYYVNYVPHGYDGSEEYEPQNMEFFFLKGRSNLRYSEKRGEQGKAFDNYIAANNPTRTVNITGMHSPEGSTQINSELAQDRPKEVEKYYKELAGKYDYTKEVDDINFVTKPVVENWTAFKELLKANTKLNDNQKNEIMAIVDGPGNFVSKELKLQTLSSYRVVVREIYPPLRAAKAEILKIKDKLSEAEISVLAQKIAKGEEDSNKLNDKQLAFAAASTPDLKEKESIYKAGIKKSEGYEFYNNLGAVYMEMMDQEREKSKKMALLDQAIEQFNKSLEKRESPEAFANLAGARLMKGEEKEALAMLDKVSGSSSGSVGTSVNALKGYDNLKKGKYRDALQNLSSAGNNSTVLYNKALAQLLESSLQMNESGYPRAMEMFEEAINADENNAYAYYGAAISAARTKNAEKMAEHLKKAVSMNKDLKTRAVSDLEFLAFFENTAFKDALK